MDVPIKLTDDMLLGAGSVGQVYKIDKRTAVKKIPIGQGGINKRAASRELRAIGHL